MQQPSKDEMRQARLRAFGCTSDASVAEPVEKRQALSPIQPVSTMSFELFNDLQRILYKGGEATEEDMQRWKSGGFQFYTQPMAFGLKQGHGGPCGVLAVVQSEIIRELFFDSRSLAAKYQMLPAFGVEEVQHALVRALTSILERAAAISRRPITVLHLSNENRAEWAAQNLFLRSYGSVHEAGQALSLGLPQLQSPLGCLLFLSSVVLTKGIYAVREDMDDPQSRLIGQFGHCNQELLNLLLTGEASSNVFDGEMELGDGADSMGAGLLRVRGVRRRSSIGYLSQLEALRYCQVGSLLKVPVLPIWVLGSASHFTTLFSLDRAVNEESASERLLSALQRCFKALDRVECGFVPSARLEDLLASIAQLPDYARNPFLCHILHPAQALELARLCGLLQVEGEIILWSSFWSSVSQLMSGDVTVDSLLGATATPVEAPSIAGERLRSDSELARELQAQWDAEDPSDAVAAAAAAPLLWAPASVPALARVRTVEHRSDR
jgi:hypothetical protein